MGLVLLARGWFKREGQGDVSVCLFALKLRVFVPSCCQPDLQFCGC